MKSLNPELTAKEIKNIILNTARPIGVLEEKIATGGMLDSFSSLYAIHNKVKAYYSSDLNDWLLLEDFFNDSNDQNYSHYDHDSFKIGINSNETTSLSNNDYLSVTLSSLNKTSGLNNTITRSISLEIPSGFIKIEEY